MSALRASAADFVPVSSKNNSCLCSQLAQTQQRRVEPWQVEGAGPAEQQHSHAELDDDVGDGRYDEYGERVIYAGLEGDDNETQEQEWPDDGDWSSYEQLQQQDEEHSWQRHNHTKQQYSQHYESQQGNAQQQPCSTTAAAAAATEVDDEDSSWERVRIGPQQAVQLLQSWYPIQSVAMITQLLEVCDGRIQDALQILSDIEHEVRQTMEQQQQQQQSQARPQSPAGEPPPTASRSTAAAATTKQQQQQQRAFTLQEEAFPVLSSTAAMGKQPTSAWHKPAAAAAAVAGCGTSNGNSKWSAIVSTTAAAAARSNTKPAAGGAAALHHSHHAPGPSRTSMGSTPRPAAAAAAVPWVETGAAVSQEYAAARAEARDYARLRNTCFHQATIAYLAGDKALAKELSAKGKQAARQMWEAHDCASHQLFTRRNAKLATATATSRHGGTSSSSTAAVIDLHGLHVREVKAMLPQQLAKLAEQQQQHVSLIVGTGHHTKGPPAARLGPAVEALLHTLGYRYTQPQAGLLRVQLQQ